MVLGSDPPALIRMPTLGVCERHQSIAGPGPTIGMVTSVAVANAQLLKTQFGPSMGIPNSYVVIPLLMTTEEDTILMVLSNPIVPSVVKDPLTVHPPADRGVNV